MITLVRNWSISPSSKSTRVHPISPSAVGRTSRQPTSRLERTNLFLGPRFPWLAMEGVKLLDPLDDRELKTPHADLVQAVEEEVGPGSSAKAGVRDCLQGKVAHPVLEDLGNKTVEPEPPPAASRSA